MADCLTFYYNKDKSPEILAWDTWKELIKNVLSELQPFPDIFTLEEVDKHEEIL